MSGWNGLTYHVDDENGLTYHVTRVVIKGGAIRAYRKRVFSDGTLSKKEEDPPIYADSVRQMTVLALPTPSGSTSVEFSCPSVKRVSKKPAITSMREGSLNVTPNQDSVEPQVDGCKRRTGSLRTVYRRDDIGVQPIAVIQHDRCSIRHSRVSPLSVLEDVPSDVPVPGVDIPSMDQVPKRIRRLGRDSTTSKAGLKPTVKCGSGLATLSKTELKSSGKTTVSAKSRRSLTGTMTSDGDDAGSSVGVESNVTPVTRYPFRTTRQRSSWYGAATKAGDAFCTLALVCFASMAAHSLDEYYDAQSRTYVMEFSHLLPKFRTRTEAMGGEEAECWLKAEQ